MFFLNFEDVMYRTLLSQYFLVRIVVPKLFYFFGLFEPYCSHKIVFLLFIFQSMSREYVFDQHYDLPDLSAIGKHCTSSTYSSKYLVNHEKPKMCLEIQNKK